MAVLHGGVCGRGNAQRLGRLQNEAMRIILGTDRRTYHLIIEGTLLGCNLYTILYISSSILVGILFCKKKIATKTQMGHSTFKCSAATDWNGLPRDIRELGTDSYPVAIYEFRGKGEKIGFY